MDTQFLTTENLNQRDIPIFLNMISLKQMVWGIGAGIALIAFSFALPTMHGIIEIYVKNGALKQVKLLTSITGLFINPLTALLFYFYGMGFRGGGRLFKIKSGIKIGWIFLCVAIGHLIFSISTIYYGFVVGNIALKEFIISGKAQNIVKTAGYIKGTISIIPDTFIIIGSIFIFDYFLKSKKVYGSSGAIIIFIGVFITIFAKFYMFYKPQKDWFIIWEIGNGINCAGLAVTTYALYTQIAYIIKEFNKKYKIE